MFRVGFFLGLDFRVYGNSQNYGPVLVIDYFAAPNSGVPKRSNLKP